MKNIKKFKPLLRFIKEDKKKIIIAVILITFVGIIDVTYGYFNGMALEELTNLNLKMCLIYLLLFFVVNTLGSVVIFNYSIKILKKVELNVNQKMSKELFSKTLDLPANAFEETTSGNIINRVTSDVATINSSFKDVVDIVVGILGGLLIFIYIFINSNIIGLEIIIFVILMAFIIKHYNPLIKKIDEETKTKNDKFVSSINEDVRGIREIKTLGIKQNVFMCFNELCNALMEYKNKGINTTTNYRILLRGLQCILEVGTFAICAILFINKMIPLSFYVAMTYYIYRYTYFIENFSSLAETYQKMVVSMERINEVLNNTLYKDEQFGSEVIDECEGYLDINNISFGYSGDLILKDFNLKVNPNEKIAIIGKSGQGKSTIFNLITKLFNPTEGNIYLDGIDINDICEYSLRKHISIIRQDPFIFNMTILDNFKMIKPNITLEEARKYSKEAYIDDYIISLPNNYDTIIGEGGVNLSGGQKQRLSIARTLAKESKIILFDEATSALDNESQKYIKKTIDNLAHNHTIIIVAHRFSTILDANQIYVMDKGKIIGHGTHEELLKTNKIYKKLYQLEGRENEN